MRLAEHLKAKELDDRKTLVRRYRELLVTGDSITAAQLEELQSIMEKLGYDSVRVAKDADAVAMRRKLQTVASGEADAEKKMNAARQAHATWCDEAERIIKETEAKTTLLLSGKHEAERVFGACRNAHRKLIELDTANKELFNVNDGELASAMRIHEGKPAEMKIGG